MIISLLKAKIHRATVTQTDISYMGSITIDQELMDAAGILEYEKVLVVDLNNGNRLETYCLKGKAGSGTVCLNGAAARLIAKGDKVIIMAFCAKTPDEAKNGHTPTVVFVDENNAIAKK
jgi:aspartate 1-decarboxylase